MKTTLVISVLAAFASAAATAAPPPGVQLYTLQTQSEKVKAQSNLFLSSKGGKIGAFPGTRENAKNAQEFFTSAYAPSGTVSIHPGSETHQVGLQGTNGLLQLVDLDRPSGETINPALPTMWSVFTLGPRGNVLVKDGQDAPSRTWVIWTETDGNFYIGLWDGVTPQARAVANITLVANKVTR